ncbi:hypothetical protein GCM10022421_10120 [Oceanisphaera sediminis]|uniref:DUF5801 domain-containing protein n=1 Tax=Oceanisphaera sediminis TaxID=981381 RepID=A0ABP7DH88_9GAMM
MLKNHADVTTGAGQVAVAELGQILTIDEDAALGGAFQHVDAADQGAFAGTGFPDDAHDLAGGNVEIDVSDGMNGGVTFTVAFTDIG